MPLATKIIEAACNGIPNSLYLRATDKQANTELDQLDLKGKTVVIYNNLPTVKHEVAAGIYREYPIEIKILKLADHDDTDGQGDAIREELLPVADYLFKYLTADPTTTPAKTTETYTVDFSGAVSIFDEILTGLTLRFNLYFDATRCAPMTPDLYSLEMEAGEGGTTIPVPGIGTYQKGTQIAYAALPEEGYAFQDWTIDGIKSTAQAGIITMTKNIKAVAAFLKAAFQIRLHVFDTIPKNRGNRFYFGDLAKDNDVLIKNCRIANLTGNESITSARKITAVEFNNINIKFICESTTATKTIFYCGGGATNQKGIHAYQSSNNFIFYISDGASGSNFTVSNFIFEIGRTYDILINWNGQANSKIDININGWPYEITPTITWSGESFSGVSLFAYNNGVSGKNICKFYYLKIEGIIYWIPNHGQGSTFYDISGNGNDGTINAPDLAAFWGATSDEAEPYDTTIGATLYEKLGTTQGPELVTNGTFDTDTSGWILQPEYTWQAGKVKGITTRARYFLQDGIPVEADTEYQLKVTVSELTRGEPFVRISTVEGYNIERSLASGINILQFQAQSTGTVSIYFFAGTTAGGGGECAFDSVSLRAVIPAENAGSILPICMDTDVEIPNFIRLGYFAPGSGILRGLPNKYEIPVDAELNQYLPAGDYDWYDLQHLPPSENIELEVEDDRIALLKVHV